MAWHLGLLAECQDTGQGRLGLVWNIKKGAEQEKEGATHLTYHWGS